MARKPPRLRSSRHTDEQVAIIRSRLRIHAYMQDEPNRTRKFSKTYNSFVSFMNSRRNASLELELLEYENSDVLGKPYILREHGFLRFLTANTASHTEETHPNLLKDLEMFLIHEKLLLSDYTDALRTHTHHYNATGLKPVSVKSLQKFSTEYVEEKYREKSGIQVSANLISSICRIPGAANSAYPIMNVRLFIYDAQSWGLFTTNKFSNQKYYTGQLHLSGEDFIGYVNCQDKKIALSGAFRKSPLDHIFYDCLFCAQAKGKSHDSRMIDAFSSLGSTKKESLKSMDTYNVELIGQFDQSFNMRYTNTYMDKVELNKKLLRSTADDNPLGFIQALLGGADINTRHPKTGQTFMHIANGNTCVFVADLILQRELAHDGSKAQEINEAYLAEFGVTNTTKAMAAINKARSEFNPLVRDNSGLLPSNAGPFLFKEIEAGNTKLASVASDLGLEISNFEDNYAERLGINPDSFRMALTSLENYLTVMQSQRDMPSGP